MSCDSDINTISRVCLASFECPAGYHKCPGSYCIGERFVCDGKKHCEWGEDELNCGKLRNSVKNL